MREGPSDLMAGLHICGSWNCFAHPCSWLAPGPQIANYPSFQSFTPAYSEQLYVLARQHQARARGKGRPQRLAERRSLATSARSGAAGVGSRTARWPPRLGGGWSADADGNPWRAVAVNPFSRSSGKFEI